MIRLSLEGELEKDGYTVLVAFGFKRRIEDGEYILRCAATDIIRHVSPETWDVLLGRMVAALENIRHTPLDDLERRTLGP